MIDIEVYQTLKEEAEERKQKAWEEYQKASDIDRDILLNLVALKGKYIKVEEDGEYKYIFVSHEFETLWYGRMGYPAILLRGLGFVSAFSDHWDYNYIKWDTAMEAYIRFDQFEEDCSKITEITKEEFNKAFREMITKVSEQHTEWCEDTY